MKQNRHFASLPGLRRDHSSDPRSIRRNRCRPSTNPQSYPQQYPPPYPPGNANTNGPSWRHKVTSEASLGPASRRQSVSRCTACGRWPVRFRMVRVTLLVPEAGPSSPTGRRTASCQPGRLCNRARANRSDISAYSGPPNLRPHTGVPAGVWLLRTSQRPLSEGSMRTAQRPLRKNIPNHPSTSEGQVS